MSPSNYNAMTSLFKFFSVSCTLQSALLMSWDIICNLSDMTQNRVFVDYFQGSRNIHHRYKLVKLMIFNKLLFHYRAEPINQQPQKQHADSICWAEWNRSSISIIVNTCVYPTCLLPKWLLGKKRSIVFNWINLYLSIIIGLNRLSSFLHAGT